jgi:hypothetical protein
MDRRHSVRARGRSLSHGICGWRSVCSMYDRRSASRPRWPGALTFPVTAQSPGRSDQVCRRTSGSFRCSSLASPLRKTRSPFGYSSHHDRGMNNVGVRPARWEFIEVEGDMWQPEQPPGQTVAGRRSIASSPRGHQEREASRGRASTPPPSNERIRPVGQAWRALAAGGAGHRRAPRLVQSVITRDGPQPATSGRRSISSQARAAGASYAAGGRAETGVADVDLTNRVQVVERTWSTRGRLPGPGLAVAVGHATEHVFRSARLDDHASILVESWVSV